MNEHDATEIAFKNGYKRGMEDAVRKMVVRIMEDALVTSLLSDPPKYMLEIQKDAIYQIANEILEGENDAE